MDRPVPQISLKEQRERTVRTLCEHFAHDHLEVEEFEARLDRAHRARAQDELAALVQDLPALRPGGAAAAAAGRTEGPARTPQRPRVPVKGVRESRNIVAIMSGVERRGAWQPAERMQVVAVMGGVELDFRDAVLPAGVTEVSIFCIMGGVDIIVPPGVVVDVNGFAIMGAFENRAPATSADPDAPVLAIDGFCLMGGVDVKVRQSGESARDARRRVREEKKLERSRRRLGGGTE
jgi:hypothetical protein